MVHSALYTRLAPCGSDIETSEKVDQLIVLVVHCGAAAGVCKPARPPRTSCKDGLEWSSVAPNMPSSANAAVSARTMSDVTFVWLPAPVSVCNTGEGVW